MIASVIVIVAASGLGQVQVVQDPGHPLADVAGWVATVGGGAADPFVGGGELPPAVPGWPVHLSVPLPQEGAVLVEADGDLGPEVLLSAGKVVYLLNDDGTNVPGWPKTIANGTALAGGPAFGDLDGDGDGEVVVCAENWPNGSIGWVLAYHTDGTAVEGFPALTQGDHSRSPTVSDLDGDGSAEIIVGERDWPLGKVYVFGGDGSLLPGWPREINHVPASSAGAADLDGDGVKEIVYESYESIYAFHMDGTIVEGFPYTPATGDVFSYSAPTFADVDGDGLPEIAVGGHSLAGTSHMILLDGDGTDMPGWPRPVSWWIYAPATFADVDDDAELEIIVGDQVLSPNPANRVHAWNADGSPAAGWPSPLVDAINAQVIVGDIDGDSDPELIWDDNTTQGGGTGKLVGFHHDGTPIEGWPLITDGSTFFNTVTLADWDGDGDVELQALAGAVQGADLNVYAWDVEGDADSVQVSMFQYGPGRDGVVPAGGCPGDFNGDGELDVLDFVAFQGAFVGQDPAADCDGNGSFDVLDFVCFQGVFQMGCG